MEIKKKKIKINEGFWGEGLGCRCKNNSGLPLVVLFRQSPQEGSLLIPCLNTSTSHRHNSFI